MPIVGAVSPPLRLRAHQSRSCRCPVKAYSTTISEGGAVALDQLHKVCNSRIEMPKTCPMHGEVKSDEIVMGYEFAAELCAIVDPPEIEKLRPAKDRSVRIGGCIKEDAISSAQLTTANR